MTIEVIVAAEADENEMGKLASQEPEISPASSRLTQFRSANCTRAGRGFCWLSPGRTIPYSRSVGAVRSAYKYIRSRDRNALKSSKSPSELTESHSPRCGVQGDERLVLGPSPEMSRTEKPQSILMLIESTRSRAK